MLNGKVGPKNNITNLGTNHLLTSLISVTTETEFLRLAGALTEHFLEGSLFNLNDRRLTNTNLLFLFNLTKP